MKRLLKLWLNRHMIRPTVSLILFKGLLLLMLSLLWCRFLDDAGRGLGVPFEVFGLLLWVLVWFHYLKTDGVSFLNLKKQDPEKPRRGFRLPDIIDFTDEAIHPLEGLEEEEKSACRMFSNMILGTVLLLLRLILWFA